MPGQTNTKGLFEKKINCRISLASPRHFLQELRATLKYLTVVGISEKIGNFLSI
jgi:hypothetical protein